MAEPTQPEPIQPVELTVVDTNTAQWELFPVDYIDADLDHLPLYEDPQSAMMVVKMTYRAGSPTRGTATRAGMASTCWKGS